MKTRTKKYLEGSQRSDTSPTGDIKYVTIDFSSETTEARQKWHMLLSAERTVDHEFSISVLQE